MEIFTWLFLDIVGLLGIIKLIKVVPVNKKETYLRATTSTDYFIAKNANNKRYY